MPRLSSIIALSAAISGANALSEPAQITARAELPARQQQDCPYVDITHVDPTTSIEGCCVGGDSEVFDPYLSVCEGWPICQGPVSP